jgi:hypothetical protein
MTFAHAPRGGTPDVNALHMITAGADEGRFAGEVSIERMHVARGPQRKKRPRPIQSRRASVVEIGIGGEQVEDEAFYDATSIAAMRIGCLTGNARNAVAMAAIAANTQADRKT